MTNSQIFLFYVKMKSDFTTKSKFCFGKHNVKNNLPTSAIKKKLYFPIVLCLLQVFSYISANGMNDKKLS